MKRALSLLAFVSLLACNGDDAAPVTARTDAGAPQAPAHDLGLADSTVVCKTCSPALLAAKRKGIRLAMLLLPAYAGSDVRAANAPVTFHLDGDDLCGTADEMRRTYGFVTGKCTIDPTGRAHVCLFDVEKDDRAQPFTPANARLLTDQVLPLHEATHLWLIGRVADERAYEPFAKMVSLALSGSMPDACAFRVAGGVDQLVAALCDAGMTAADLPDVLRLLDVASRAKGAALTNAELASVVSAVIGGDATPAFRAAGLL